MESDPNRKGKKQMVENIANKEEERENAGNERNKKRQKYETSKMES